ncbi:MAG: hypothetical protein WA459_23415, partial [Stellaceae bacterium]
GGAFAIERAPDQRTRLVVTLGLEIEEGATEPTLDLGNRQVLIATEDAEFASKLGETVAAWNGDVRWVGDADGALANLSRHGATERQVLIVDGRKLLGALSLAHRAARIRVPAPFVLLIAEDGQIASLGEVDDGEIDGFIPAPPTRQLLANALDALPLGLLDSLASDLPATPPIVYPPRPVVEPPGELTEVAPGELSGRFSERITPIASHPKFAPEMTALDMRAIDGLRALGDDPDFLGEVIETFKADAREIMGRLDQAVTAADATGFALSLSALRRAASPLGATQLCELLASLQEVTASELRQHGAIHLQRLDAEIDRFGAALTQLLETAEASRP